MDGRTSDFWTWVERERGLFFYLLLIVLAVLSVWMLPRSALGDTGARIETATSMVALEVGPTTPPATAVPTVTTPTVAATEPTEPATAPARTGIEATSIRPTSATPAGDKTADKPLSGSPTYSILQMFGALGVVIGLILIGRAVARKFVPGANVGAGQGVMELLARYPLSRKESLVMVRIGSQIVVLSQGRDRTESVLVISEPTEVANVLGQIQGTKPTSIQAGFGNLLANARMDLESGVPAEEPSLLETRRIKAEAETPEADLDAELDEMAAARRQLMDLRERVKAVREQIK